MLKSVGGGTFYVLNSNSAKNLCMTSFLRQNDQTPKIDEKDENDYRYEKVYGGILTPFCSKLLKTTHLVFLQGSITVQNLALFA